MGAFYRFSSLRHAFHRLRFSSLLSPLIAFSHVPPASHALHRPLTHSGKNPGWMKRECPASCGVCQSLGDEDLMPADGGGKDEL